MTCASNSTDEKLLNELEKHLSLLTRQPGICLWTKQSIHPGAKPKQEISRYVSQAHLIALLVSQDFLNECDEELELVRKEMTVRKVHVIPLLTRPSGWQHTFLKELQPLPMNKKIVPQNRSDREQTIYDIAEYIRKAVEKMHRDLLEGG